MNNNDILRPARSIFVGPRTSVVAKAAETSRTLPSGGPESDGEKMIGMHTGINSGIILALGMIVSTVGLAGSAIYSITPEGTIGLHPVYTAVAVLGILIVIASSFVEAWKGKKTPDPDDLY
jgi:hypothetical protein